eukprot:8403868-Pyramimonas_sp.AAC.1
MGGHGQGALGLGHVFRVELPTVGVGSMWTLRATIRTLRATMWTLKATMWTLRATAWTLRATMWTYYGSGRLRDPSQSGEPTPNSQRRTTTRADPSRGEL